MFAALFKTATNLAIEKVLAELAEFAASWAAMLAEMALTAEQRCHEAAAQEKALADNTELQRCQEFAAPAAALAELVSAVKQSRQESADCPAVLVETTLADESRRQKEAERGMTLGEMVLAAEQRCSLLEARAAELAVATARVVVLADSFLTEPALAKDKRHQEETAKKQRRADDKRIMVPVLPPDPGNATIRRIRVECPLLAAPLDAILTEIEHDDIAHEAGAPATITSPHPAAMLSTPPRPITYVGAVLSTMGGAIAQCSLLWHRWLYHRLLSMATSQRYAGAPDLVVALVATTILVRPVLLMRSYPPTLIQLWRGFQCQQTHRTCWQEQLHAKGRRHLPLLRRHPLLPLARYVYLRRELLPIHSVLVA